MESPVLFSAVSIWPTVAFGHAERNAAKAPATCGAAIDVPLNAEKLGEGGTEDVMLSPGANKSTMADTFEKLDTASALVVELTVTALEMQPGNAL